MHHWSIATKITVWTCLLMSVLLLVYASVLWAAQRSREAEFSAGYRNKLEQAIQKDETEARDALRLEMRFHADTVGRISSGFLYNIDGSGLQRSLRPFLKVPAIIAVQVWDEDARPFAAVWRDGDELLDGAALPEALARDEKLQAGAVSLLEEEVLGRVSVFFSDALLQAKITALKRRAQADLAEFQKSADARLQSAGMTLFIGTGGMLLGLVIVQLAALRLLVFKRLLKVSAWARRLTALDLSVAMEADSRGHDEIGRMFHALHEMIQTFKQTLAEVQHNGVQLASSMVQLSAGTQQQRTTINAQLATLDHTIERVRVITAATHQLSDTLREVGDMSRIAETFAENSQAHLEQLHGSAERMDDGSRAVLERLQGIHREIEGITEITVAMTKVADQTNLLSLNAAIEAEKAGEAGRGFRVVAREIRRLADEAAVATLDIENTVDTVRAAATEGVAEIIRFIEDIGLGAADADRISTELERLIEQIRLLSPKFARVDTEMQAHAASAQEISRTLEGVGEEVAETTESVNASFTAIVQLDEVAHNLRRAVSKFTLN